MSRQLFRSSAGTALCLILITAGARPSLAAVPDVRRARYLMGTICEIGVPGGPTSEKDINAAFDEISRVERLLSTWQENTPLSLLNAARPGTSVVVPSELFTILFRASEWSIRTRSAFHPLLGRLIDAWKIRGMGRLPDRDQIAALRDEARLENVVFDAFTATITRNSPAQFEEGAFGKGYAIDRALLLLADRGLRNVEINFGGQLGWIGEARPVIVANPADRGVAAVSLMTARRSVSTTSGSEKSFDIAKKHFTHLIDPRSGWSLPPRGSVTVFEDSAFDADVLSTALYVMGPEEGKSWAEAHQVEALFIVPSGGARKKQQYEVLATLALVRNSGDLTILDQKLQLKVVPSNGS